MHEKLLSDREGKNRKWEMNHHNTPGVAYGVYVVRHHAYIADGWCGLRIMDISNPEYPEKIGHLVTPGYAWGVDICGNPSPAPNPLEGGG